MSYNTKINKLRYIRLQKSLGLSFSYNILVMTFNIQEAHL